MVDDEQDICRALEFLLSREGYLIDTANNAEKALQLFQRMDYDLVLSDMRMDGMDGIELLGKIKADTPSAIVVIMTAYASVEGAVDSMKRGAADYIVKPFVNDDVKMTIRRLLEKRALEIENLALRRALSDRIASNSFIGNAPRVHEIFELLEKVIPTKSNILIFGESGTGKGLIAEIIHKNSPRSQKPFVSINCSAIPETLLESELFGYRKGAFTGANTDKTGLFVMADEGTLFLDEIGDMPVGLQSKILKVIETGSVMPVGDTRPKQIDVRVLAATNKNIVEMMAAGEFRSDLYYRLNVIEVSVPPLRERKEDIMLLARHFLEKFNRDHSKNIVGFSEDAENLLLGFPWPGNARELKNVIERAVVICGGDEIAARDLPERLAESSHASINGGSGGAGLRDSLNYYERKLIQDFLSRHGGSKEEAAKDLGIDLATLYRKMKKFGMT